MTAACCDVSYLDTLQSGAPLHLDGNLLSTGYQRGYKQRDPGLAACCLTADSMGPGDNLTYNHGLFNFATQVTSDARNALVWCAADEGKRVKAFVAPKGVEPVNKDAACNRGEGNGITLQYTFSTDVEGLNGSHAGLHVMGTKVLCVNSKCMGSQGVTACEFRLLCFSIMHNHCCYTISVHLIDVRKQV